MNITVEGKEFEERSDYINDSDLITWNVRNDYFDNIQKELLGSGTRLLVGPRGTGKTHQMKFAYQTCVRQPTKPTAVFLTFNKYFHLEPLLIRAPNAIKIFHTWVLAKVLLGCYSFLRECNIDVDERRAEIETNFIVAEESLKVFESIAESPFSSQLDSNDLIQNLSISKVISSIEYLIYSTKRQRAIVLLDDAAFTLTPDYFVEFLDIFRNLKTKLIAPKASVYPGTTQYSPRFHVGHDAQFVPCWMSVENERYSEFMESLINVRFPSYKDDINNDILELYKYASFGVPRTLIGLIASHNNTSSTERSWQSRFNSVIDQRVTLIEAEYLSLKQKLPQYDRVIQIGWEFFRRIINELKEDNKTLQDEKNYVIGILNDKNRMTLRMVGFLMEAGLLYLEESTVKHGEQREYKRYIPHLIFLIQNRTFSRGKGLNLSETLNLIAGRSRKHPLRRTFPSLLGNETLGNLKLDLPPCQNCKTPRLSEEQKFCHNCGSQLVNQSTFERCLSMQIDELPLTDWQKGKIHEVQVNTIGDFLSLSNPGGELRKVRGIGKVRSEQITNFINDTVAVTLDKTLTDFLS